MNRLKKPLLILTLVGIPFSSQNAFALKPSAAEVKQMQNTFQSFLKCADQENSYLDIRKCRKPLVDSTMKDVVIDRYLGINSKYVKANALVECPEKTVLLQKKHYPEVAGMLCFSSQFSSKGDSSVLFKKDKTLKISGILL